MLDRPPARPLAILLALTALLAARAQAAPPQFVPVGDPIEAELRILDLDAGGADSSGLALPHLDAWPLEVRGLLGVRGRAGGLDGWRGLAARRVRRELERDADGALSGEGPTSTPRLLQRAWPGDQRLEVSAGFEGERDVDDSPGGVGRDWLDGSGLHVRAGVQVDHWFLYSHLFAGELHGVRAFSDPLVANSDVALSTEESYVAYSSGTAWDLQLGRSRWSWGPGEEGSLLLSRTAAPLNGLMLHARLEAVRLDAFAFDATTDPGSGEQLAAHRLEWQPWDNTRLGVSEAARYHAGGWQGVYLAGVVPYALAQRLLDQDHPDTTGTLRNNVMVSMDASVRVADGSRIYGELLIDDLHARTAMIPNKYGWQLGWNGAGEVLGTRVSWNAEATWLSRYVYTSYFGRTFEADGMPIGFPTGPGSRRLRSRVTWDPGGDWQLEAVAARTRRGAEGIDDPFVPGGTVPDPSSLAGVVQETRTLDGTIRFWPASGVDVSVRAGREWIDGLAHVAGASSADWRGALALRLTR
ncbi:MAG TPA: capsule assembly Wzi family protein [Candidatus Acidoferrales bacterium]|nr:capsule assembly Wzi family protein [Candidatus Acidoferrales bacterium]